MSLYNSRMIERTILTLDPVPQETSHKIRLFSFPSGLMIVGWIIGSENGAISCVFPLELQLFLNEDDSVAEYEFTPYLENLAEFDINEPYPYTFPITSLQSVIVPSHHVVRNYMGHLLMHKQVGDEIRGKQDMETLH